MNKIATLAILLITIACTISNGQPVDHINKKIRLLQKAGIDTLIKFDTYCSGSKHMLKDTTGCVPFEKKYLIWIESGKYHLQRFDECFDYKDSVVESESLSYYNNKLAAILKEEIKPVQYYKTGKLKEKSLVTVYVDHSCVMELHFILKSKTTGKRVDDFETTTKFVDDLTYTEGRAVNVKR
jgi:hypothetical protein